MPCGDTQGLAAEAEAEAGGVSPLMQAPGPEGGGEGPGAGPGRSPGVARAIWRNVKSSPTKLNLAATLVRRLHMDEAILQCEASPKKAAGILRQVLLSAKANAVTNHGLDAERLYVDRAFVGKGTYLKRPWYAARGKSSIRTKYRSHVTVQLKEAAKPPLRKLQLVPTLADRIARRRTLEGAGEGPGR